MCLIFLRILRLVLWNWEVFPIYPSVIHLNRSMKVRLILMVVIFIYFPLFSQDITNENLINEVIEFAIQHFDEDLDISVLHDELVNMLSNPVNLNYAGPDELNQLFFLTEFQKASILQYRQDNGKFLSTFELQLVYGFDEELVQLMIPFIEIGVKNELNIREIKEPMKSGRHELLIREQRVLEDQEGFAEVEDSLVSRNPNSKYLGNP